MVQNFKFKHGYRVYKLRPPVCRSKMTNRLHVSPELEESMKRGNKIAESFGNTSHGHFSYCTFKPFGIAQRVKIPIPKNPN